MEDPEIPKEMKSVIARDVLPVAMLLILWPRYKTLQCILMEIHGKSGIEYFRKCFIHNLR